MAYFRQRSLGWWYWLATGILMILAAPFAQTWALAAVMALTVVQAVHFTWRRGSVTAFPVQVRIAYLVLLFAGAVAAPLEVIHWLQGLGTWVMLLAGYCPLARTMALMPWNRSGPLTLDLLRRTFLTPPVPVATSLTGSAGA